MLVLALAAGGLFAQPWTWCPADWSGASRIVLSGGSFGDVLLDGKPYRVGGSALLDYMPRVVSSPLDHLANRLRGRHPLSVNASISASSRDVLGEPVFTCFRVSRGNEVRSARPRTYATQTAADGSPPGATLPARIEAWRQAHATGPEWPPGELIGLELWASVNGRRYIFVLPPFTLMKGG